MADYTQSTDFSAKDALATGDPAKVIYGADIDAELALVSSAIASKVDDINTLSEDTNPNKSTDLLVTYDDSASAHKKVYMPRLLGPVSTLAYAVGNVSQPAIGSGSWTEVNCIRTELIDTAGCYDNSANSRVSSPGSVYDGYYMVFGRLSISGALGSTFRLAVTRFNSSGVPQSRKYSEYSISVAGQFIGFGMHNLTNSSGDYIALEVWSDGTFSIANSTQNELIAFKI